MPWREVSVMDQRREFVRLAMQEGVNRRELCRRPGTRHGQVFARTGRQHPAEAVAATVFFGHRQTICRGGLPAPVLATLAGINH
jgi:hypothetical protein